MEKIYKIFISSTYIDLKEHRRKVVDAILKMQHLPVGMEMFNASSDSQWKIITDTIDDCDYYVLIVGKRYGSVVDSGSDKGMSYTEREFRYAMDQGIPYMGFLVSDDATIVASNTETDPVKLGKLNKFRKLVESNGTVNYWVSADELAAQVRSPLEAEIIKHPRNGWKKGNIHISQSAYKPVKLHEETDADTLDLEALKKEGINVDDDDILQDYLFERYEKDENGWYYKKVPDGEHVRRALFEEIKLEEGIFKDDTLIEGISYNWILKFWKPLDMNDSDDDYNPVAPTIEELTDDVEHDNIHWCIELQYGGGFDFYHIEDEVEHEGLEKYFVADKKVYDSGRKIDLFNMRTLSDFLEQYDPEKLHFLMTGEYETTFDEEVEDIDFSGLKKGEQ